MNQAWQGCVTHLSVTLPWQTKWGQSGEADQSLQSFFFCCYPRAHMWFCSQGQWIAFVHGEWWHCPWGLLSLKVHFLLCTLVCQDSTALKLPIFGWVFGERVCLWKSSNWSELLCSVKTLNTGVGFFMQSVVDQQAVFGYFFWTLEYLLIHNGTSWGWDLTLNTNFV